MATQAASTSGISISLHVSSSNPFQPVQISDELKKRVGDIVARLQLILDQSYSAEDLENSESLTEPLTNCGIRNDELNAAIKAIDEHSDTAPLSILGAIRSICEQYHLFVPLAPSPSPPFRDVRSPSLPSPLPPSSDI